MPEKVNRVVSSQTPIETYQWGDGCEAKVLAADKTFSVKQETIPTGSGEQLHFHKEAVQFFFILKGEAWFEIDQNLFPLKTGEGITIYPSQQHRIFNTKPERLEFIVYSQPSTERDRINL